MARYSPQWNGVPTEGENNDFIENERLFCANPHWLPYYPWIWYASKTLLDKYFLKDISTESGTVKKEVIQLNQHCVNHIMVFFK